MTSKASLIDLNNTLGTVSRSNMTRAQSNHDFYIGLTLAISSSFFIGSSFILKKKGLIKLSSAYPDLNSQPKKGLRAAQGGYGYLKEWLWWSGFLTMGLGELCNFTAYGFVPATLVTPLGALSVLVSAVMAAYFLDEKLNTIGKIGCALTAIGSTVMVIHAPKEGEINSLQELLYKLLDIEFVIFVILSIVSLFVLIYVLVPKYGNTNVLIYILICSILGSYTVMSCKGVSLGIKEIISAKPTVPYLYTSLFALVAITCIVIQINYLNKSLDVFNTAIVTTVYYVLFSLFVMIASALLFKELMNVSFQDFVGCMCGFSTIICALCLIHFFKSEDDMKNYNSFSLEKHNKNNELIPSNDTDIESNSESVPKFSNEQPSNDNGLFENLSKKQSNQNEMTTYADVYDQKYTQKEQNSSVKFQNLNIEKANKNTNFSFLNYLSNNYKNLETKIYRYKNSNFSNYNYNKLMSNEINDEMTDQMYNENNAYIQPSRYASKSHETKTNDYKSKNRYFTSFNESDEQNLLEKDNKRFRELDLEEEIPLNA